MQNRAWVRKSRIFPSSSPHPKGFTLIETIMTLVVLSIAAMGVLAVFTTGIKGSADPLILSQAIQLAQGEMETVMGEKMASGFSAATLATGATVSCQSPLLAGFSCNRNIFYVDPGNLNAAAGAPPTEYKHVTVTISQAAIGSISLDTVIANY